VFSGRGVSSEDDGYVRALGLPLFALVEGGMIDQMQATYGAPAFRESAVAIFRLNP
jgi:hypothetical protein